MVSMSPGPSSAESRTGPPASMAARRGDEREDEQDGALQAGGAQRKRFTRLVLSSRIKR